MIKFAQKKHTDGIIRLWNEAFGDSREEIESILCRTLSRTVVCVESETVCGMLTLLPVRLENKNGFYVYAVATLKSCRGQGISTKLLNFAKNLNADFLVLVPQSDSLFGFYEKRGFVPVCCINKSEVLPEKMGGITFKKIPPAEYCDTRQKFCSKEVVFWSEEMLLLAQELYGGSFCGIYKQERTIGVGFYYKHDGRLYIKELLSEHSTDILAGALGAEEKAESVCYAACGEDRFAMIYPESDGNIYFNIAFD